MDVAGGADCGKALPESKSVCLPLVPIESKSVCLPLAPGEVVSGAADRNIFGTGQREGEQDVVLLPRGPIESGLTFTSHSDKW